MFNIKKTMKTIKIVSLIILNVFYVAYGQQIKTEDFQTFLEKFNTDEAFQKSRVVFPFIYQYHDSYLDDYQTIEINAQDWEHESFKWDSTYMQRAENAYDRELINKEDTCLIHFKGIGNGINVQAVFVCKNNKWYYLKLIDNSM